MLWSWRERRGRALWRLVLPRSVSRWPLTTLRERLVKPPARRAYFAVVAYGYEG
jgi:hypothetical protein